MTKKEFEEIKAQYEGVKALKNRYEQDELSFNLAMHTVTSIIKKYSLDKGETEERLRGFYDQLHKLFVDSTNELREKRIAFVNATNEMQDTEQRKKEDAQRKVTEKLERERREKIEKLVRVGISEEKAAEIIDAMG